MALPAGITTATVLFGKDFDVLGGGNDVTLRITPSHTLIWEATGDRLTAFDVAVSAESDTVGTFELPHTDQAGFINEAGAEITDWWYTIVGTVRAGRAQKTYTKRVQVTSDVTSFDLDTLPINTPVGPVGSVPLPTLTSVNGQTGAVVLTASAIGAIPNTSEGRQALAESTELSATIDAVVEAAIGEVESSIRTAPLIEPSVRARHDDILRNRVLVGAVHTLSAADAATSLGAGTSTTRPVVSGTINPSNIFKVRRAAWARHSTTFPGYTAVKPTGLTSLYGALPGACAFHITGSPTAFEIITIMNNSGLRVQVNGQAIPVAGQSEHVRPPTVSDGSVRRDIITLGSNAPAGTIHVDIEGGQGYIFNGVTVPSGCTVVACDCPTEKRLIVIGNSQVEPTYGGERVGSRWAAAAGGQWFGFAPQLGELLGTKDAWPSGSGGTGIGTNGGTTGRFKYGERVQADVIDRAPNLVLTWDLLNDQNVAIGTFETDLRAYLDLVETGLPGVPHVVAAALWPNLWSAEPSGLAAKRALLHSVAAEYENVRVLDPIAEKWLDTSEKVTRYIGTDTSHYSREGHLWVARMVYAWFVAHGLA